MIQAKWFILEGCWKSAETLVAQVVKNLPVMREMQVHSLGWKDPLEKEMTTHSSFLAWEILWTEDLAGYSPHDPRGRRSYDLATKQ